MRVVVGPSTPRVRRTDWLHVADASVSMALIVAGLVFGMLGRSLSVWFVVPCALFIWLGWCIATRGQVS